MAFADKTLSCRNCGNSFVFSAGEQEFYATKGFVNEPTRCPTCRQARKTAMAGGSAGREPRSGDYTATRERIAYPVTCASCGTETTVPFVPRGHRPVYCSNCFAQSREAGGL